MTETLNSAKLSDLGLRRALPLGLDVIPDEVATRYDFTTFWLDAFRVANHVTLLCPKLLGIRHVLSQAVFSIDGHRIQPGKIVEYERYDLICFVTWSAGKIIRCEYQGHSCASSIADSTQDSSQFFGRNVMMTLSKNDRLSAIQDWAHYHRKIHNVQSILFFDNGSTEHNPQDVGHAIRDTGVDARVISVPNRYGLNLRHQTGKRIWVSETLQTSLLNLARLRFLSSARAVLQCDVDELVWTKKSSVFDMAVKSLSGFIQLGSVWRYAPLGNDGSRHSNHTHMIEKMTVAGENTACDPVHGVP